LRDGKVKWEVDVMVGVMCSAWLEAKISRAMHKAVDWFKKLPHNLTSLLLTNTTLRSAARNGRKEIEREWNRFFKN
jgi:hypothetical protein